MSRDKVIATIPASYNHVVHMVVPSVFGIVVVLLAFTKIDFSYYTVLTVLVSLFIAFGAEWLLHKKVLHKPQPFLEIIHIKHVAHHALYNHQDMAIRSWKELHLVLMPAYAIMFAFLSLTPAIVLIALLLGLSTAMTSLATAMMFLTVYEWLHLSYHLPADTFIGRMDLIRILRKHHQKHHNPLFMNDFNFNVTIPVFDWILRTKR